MLDTVAEEELMTRTTGMPFDQVLGLIDAVNLADLKDAYDAASDRYMVLAGKGRRSDSEALELDRLDSALRLILGERGLLTFAARLYTVLDSAYRGVLMFRNDPLGGGDFGQLAGELGRAAGACRDSFEHTPIPLDVRQLVDLLDDAAAAAAALARIARDNGLLDRVFQKRRAARAVGLLTERMISRKAARSAWKGYSRLLDPRRTTAGERFDRAGLVFRLSGLAGCLRAVGLAGDAFGKTAELVRGALLS